MSSESLASTERPRPGVVVPATVGYDEFGAEFRRRAVTRERVVAALESLTSRQLQFGPYSAIPLTSIEASGSLGTPKVRVADAAHPAYAVTVPVTLDLAVRVGATSRLRADVEVDLRLTPCLADELFLFIDAAKVDAHDVRIVMRGRGLGVAVSGIAGGLPSAVTDEVRRQVARQVSGLLRGSASRRGRTVDIASRADGSPRRPTPDTLRWVDEAEFGRQFVRRAVNLERVSAGFASLSGQALEFGPLKVGPGGMATVTGSGVAGSADVRADEDGGFAIALPIELDVVIDLAREHRYHATVTARLHATPQPASDLHIVIDIPPITADDVTVALDAADNLAGMLGRAGKLEEQLVARVVSTINEQVGAASGRVIDVGSIVAGGPRPSPRGA